MSAKKSAILVTLVTTTASAQYGPDPADRADRVWAAGYAAAVKHECPAWTVDDLNVMRQHGAAIRLDPKSGPILDDAMLPVFKSGALFGVTQAARKPGFCNAPATYATRGKTWVAQFLRRR